METIWRNLRFGLRMVRKSPAFFSITILVLALGIGGTTAIFSVVYGTLLAPMPYPHPDQIVVVWSKINGKRNGVSAGDFLDWTQQSTAFEAMAAFSGKSFNISLGNIPESVPGEMVSPGYFGKVFGIGPRLGRDFLPEESQLGKDHEVILSNRLWERSFGSDRNIVGQQIRIDSEEYAVVGVLPQGAYDHFPFQIFSPLSFKPEQINHDFHWIIPMARLTDGVTIAQAQSDMDGVTHHIAAIYPKSKNWGASVELFHNDFLNRNVRGALWILLGAVSLVLLIACANVANLLLARGVKREKEIAVRAAVGATGRHLFGQLLTESVTLGLVGGAVGIAVVWVLLKAIIASLPPQMVPFGMDIKLSLPVLALSVLASAVSGALFGCVPAWHAARANLNDDLKEGARATGTAERHRLRSALVLIEIALSMTLLGGTGLLIRSLWNFTHADFGIRKDHLLTFWLPMRNDRFSDPQQNVAFYRNLLQKIQALPGVKQASASTGLPVMGPGFGMPFYVAGRSVTDPSSRPVASFMMVTPDYYRTLGITLDAGRTFTDRDMAGSEPVAMVSENFKKQFLAGVDPLSQRVIVEQLIPGVPKLGPPIEWHIVGVFHNVRFGGTSNREDQAEIDIPFWQIPWPGANIAVRTTAEPETMSKSVAAVVHSIDSDLPLTDVKTMDQHFNENLADDRFEVALLAGFAVLALILAAVGVYGVMAFEVAQRTHEIGVRMALGATRESVLSMILREGMLLAIAGLALGIGGAWLAGRAMQSLLWGVGAIDLRAFSAVSAVLLASALLACYIPARRATRIDPMVALRYE